MNKEAFWNIWSSAYAYPSVKENLTTDIVVVGGGITGITTAYLLKEQGFKVIVLEAKSVGKGTTGQSTGNLYEITEDVFSRFSSKYDLEYLEKLISSRRKAIELIRDIILTYDIDCNYQNQSMYLFEDGGMDKISEEEETAKRIHASFTKLNDSDIVFPFKNGLKLPNQAQFNPLLYVQELAKIAEGGTCKIFENSAVTQITEKKEEIELEVNKKKVTAKYVVQSTHVPKGKKVQYHSVLLPYREYAVATKVANSGFPEGIYWRYTPKGKISFRRYERGSETYFLAVGKEHKTGEVKDTPESVIELMDFLKDNFYINKIDYQWSAQNYKPADHLPYIGRLNKNSNQFVATGFSVDGLVFGTLAAKIISDTISGTENDDAYFYESTRSSPVKSFRRFIKENADVLTHFLKPGVNDKETLDSIKRGDAAIIKIRNEKAAVYRDLEGELKVLSATCPHMGCTVVWNTVEKSWDCPCHGSRFDSRGKVIEGPALHHLKQIIL